MTTTDKFAVVMKADEVEITLYDVIDGFWGISASSIYQAIKDRSGIKTIRLRINSPGGSVFEGMAIYNMLRSHPARKIVNVDGIAASMASVIALVGDDIEMGEGAWIMIHDPLGRISGDAEELREMADRLDKLKSDIVAIYARKTGKVRDEIADMMTAETWLNASEAVANGFATRQVAGLQIAACASLEQYRNVPDALRGQANQEPEPIGEIEMANDPKAPTPATYADLAALCGEGETAFICAQMKANATIEQAGTAWTAHLKQQLDVARAEAATAKAEAEEARAKLTKPGVPPLGSAAGKSDAADPVAAFKNAVNEKIAAGMAKAKAMSMVVRENPELHAEYLAAVNARR